MFFWLKGFILTTPSSLPKIFWGPFVPLMVPSGPAEGLLRALLKSLAWGISSI